jgi:hypothetical protein
MIGHPNAYIGSTLSLVTLSDIRYIGRLIGVDTKNHTVTLAKVRSMGTEGRRRAEDEVPSSSELHAYIVFRGADVKDLAVIEPPYRQQPEPRHEATRLVYRAKPHSNDCLNVELTEQAKKELQLELDFAALSVKLEESRPKEKPTGAGYNPTRSFYDCISYTNVKKPTPRDYRGVRPEGRPPRSAQRLRRRGARQSRP